MHVHGPPIDLGVADLYAAQAAKKAAEAKQAAEVRKKLLRASASSDSEFSEFVSLSIGERSGAGSRQDADDGHEQEHEQNIASLSARSANPGKAAAGTVANPLSIWA